MAFAILYSQGLSEYDFGPGHPFRGDRYEVFRPFLRERLPGDGIYKILEAEPVSDDDLLLICGKEYISFTREFYKAAASGLGYPGRASVFQSGDNIPHGRPGKIEEAARLVVGQAKAACDLVSGGDYAIAVSIGGGLHHAGPDYGEGFCLYNDVAFCGRYLIQEHKLERVMILDTDAHAGNGTCAYFYEDPSVLFIDIHQDPLTVYPGTGFISEIGSGRGQGFTVNIPMPVHAGYDDYKLVFESIVEPIAGEFRPQVIVRNGGSDPHFADVLTNLGLSVGGFRMIGEKVRAIAGECCGGKVIDLTASGYNIDILPYAWLAQITGLAGIDLPVEEPQPVPERPGAPATMASTEKVIAGLREQLKDTWKCLR